MPKFFVCRVKDLRARYQVSFQEGQSTIWRFMDTCNEQRGISVTVWKSNLLEEAVCRSLPHEQYNKTLLSIENVFDAIPHIPRTELEPSSNMTGPCVSISSKLFSDHLRNLAHHFHRDDGQKFLFVLPVLEVLCATMEPISVDVLECCLQDLPCRSRENLSTFLTPFVDVDQESGIIAPKVATFFRWLCDPERAGAEFWVDARNGHNMITATYLRYCANKSISLEHNHHEYLVCIKILYLSLYPISFAIESLR